MGVTGVPFSLIITILLVSVLVGCALVLWLPVSRSKPNPKAVQHLMGELSETQSDLAALWSAHQALQKTVRRSASREGMSSLRASRRDAREQDHVPERRSADPSDAELALRGLSGPEFARAVLKLERESTTRRRPDEPLPTRRLRGVQSDGASVEARADPRPSPDDEAEEAQDDEAQDDLFEEREARERQTEVADEVRQPRVAKKVPRRKVRKEKEVRH